ncbi:hypothetical protein Taro_023705 [Colocasia esculenta]|uniref:non-specific serine/threonine protein kinase n=1 Tax=Colocasia esculenta TaxID=4460 RepID=A0A843VI48_COLES|nr:hypothetical protein [Colocasia esculenta]
MLPPPLLSFAVPFFLLFCFCHGDSSPAPQSGADELRVLLGLKAALGIAAWREDGHPCNFSGVQCTSGAVSAIDLSDTNVSGSVPFASVCRLPSLTKLWLGGNNLYGNVTGDIAGCINLEFLDLGSNNFSGAVPDLSSLRKLQMLNLSDNGFTGEFPWASLKSMPSLFSLRIGDNPFEATRSFPEEVLGLTALKFLYLSNCSIYGQIPPSIGNLKELVNLELSDNLLYGEIPPEIGKLRGLQQLELYDNKLSGRLPAGLGNLSSLNFFDASNNSLEGNLSEIRHLTALVSLQLFENNFSGEVPQELGDFRDLVNLSLYSNRLSGLLPQALGSWAEFDFIDVSTNQFTGPIPPDMCKRGAMRRLLVLENHFSGEIPATYANCTSLLRFRANNNSLGGEVPVGLWSLPNLEIIDLSVNQFSGAIDPGVGKAKALSQISISGNQFSGELPAEISGASSLRTIDARYNRLSGEIPASIGDLRNLNGLFLQGNSLSGRIPSTLGSCSALTQLDLSENSLSGEIPATLGQLTNLNSLNLSVNHLSGKIPGSLSSLKLSSLDLSVNQLEGEVPLGLAIKAFRNGFAANRGLCGHGIGFLRSCSPFSRGPSSERLRTLLACMLAGAAIAIAIFGFFLTKRRRQRRGDEDRLISKERSWSMQSFRVVSFDEQKIIRAVRSENLVGRGGSGSVYRVDLGNGKIVAVKHIWNCPDGVSGASASMLSRRPAAASREFYAEVTTLSAVRHINVVKLFCSITSEDSSLLVYEYLPNGSLWDRLHTAEGRKLGGLDWDARYEVAVGASRGLEYLHHGCGRPVVHRDVKSSNILLDESFKPRIADFGLAKILQAAAAGGPKDASTTHVVAGTLGYLAPEYAYTMRVNEKCDVYSFGVVLMELATGKRPIEPEYGENKDIVRWVYDKLMVGNGEASAVELVDPCIPEGRKEEAVKVLRIGVRCTMRLPSLRPSMRAVVQMLEEAGDGRSPRSTAAAGGTSMVKEVCGYSPKDQTLRVSP